MEKWNNEIWETYKIKLFSSLVKIWLPSYTSIWFFFYFKYWSGERKTGDKMSDLHFNGESGYPEENTSYNEDFRKLKH